MKIKLRVGYDYFVADVTGAQLEVFMHVIKACKPVQEAYLGKQYITHYTAEVAYPTVRAEVCVDDILSADQAAKMADDEATTKANEESTK